MPTSELMNKMRALAARDDLSLSVLTHALQTLELSDDDIAALRQPDPHHPYGRRVLVATDTFEAMVATWTPGVPCAPHDHGGSVGGVKVLQGRARHHTWGVHNGEIRRTSEALFSPGKVVSCGPDIVHSMGDDGDERALVTLHFYTNSIDHMVVYDQPSKRTLVVDGGCGAWVPEEAELIRRAHDGFIPRLEAAAG